MAACREKSAAGNLSDEALPYHHHSKNNTHNTEQQEGSSTNASVEQQFKSYQVDQDDYTRAPKQ